MTNTMELQAYNIRVLKATLCQSCKKVNGIERISQSATSRDDVLFGCANSMLQDNNECQSNDIKSESDEDSKECPSNDIKFKFNDDNDKSLSNNIKPKLDDEREQRAKV